jgi:poly(A) polymerase Pap1
VEAMTQVVIVEFFRTFGQNWDWDSNYIVKRAVYLHEHSDVYFEQALVNASIYLIPILSPVPPYKCVTCPAMTISAKNKVVSELRNGWLQI